MEAATQRADTDFAIVGEIVSSTANCPSTTAITVVSDRFFGRPDVDAVALVDNDRPVGLVTRQRLLSTVFQRYGFELYGRKAVSVIATEHPVIVSDRLPLDEALRLAVQRPQEEIYDDLIVEDDGGRFVGLLSVRQMIIQHSQSLANIMVQKDLANARAAELEQLTEIKSQFLAHVTHELRSPVNAIIELGEMIRIAAEKGYTGQVQDRLALLMSSATNLRSVITNILDLSKIEAGRMQVIAEEFDLVPLLEEVVETTRVLKGDKPVDVTLSARQSEMEMFTDPVKCRQIVLNLMSNAAKFTDRGRITLSLELEADHAVIEVADTGLGIREDDLTRLFAPFTQLEDAKTKRHEGTGLGLTITSHLVGLLGGSVEVRSKFGEGTAFTVRIPKRWNQGENES
ncbi:MAG: ATP-binding protein [Thermoanaerobaculia bacterium]|jgi:signal transduction histidine kinase